jgi:DNA-binding MarR family transcriptional regulator
MSTDTPPLPFGTALALAQRYLARQFNQTMEALGLPAVEWFTLNGLGLRGPTLPTATIADLLATNGLERSAVDALLADMARRGLIETAASTATLTAAGRARFEEVRDALDADGRATFDRLDADKVEAARSLLQQIAELDGDPIRASG